MVVYQKLICKDCGSEKAIVLSRFPTAPDTTISTISLCDECRIKRVRRIPYHHRVTPIQDEISEIIKIRDFLKKNDQVVVIPNKSILEWIAEEKWSLITEFKLKIEQRAINTLIKKLNVYIGQIERVPDEVLDRDLFKQKRAEIKRFKDLEKNLENTNRLKNWIDIVEKRMNQNQELLEELYHSWKRVQREREISIEKEETLIFSGLTVFISGRQINLSDERDTVTCYLKSKGAHVLRFEDRATSKSAKKSCIDWAKNCDIYIGIFGSSYGEIVENNKSASEIEFDASTEKGIHRLIFIKSGTKEKRQQEFIDKLKIWDDPVGLIYTIYYDLEDLRLKLTNSLNELVLKGIIETKRNVIEGLK